MKEKKNNNINGVLLIDKPGKMTSYDVIRILKKKLNTKHIGHCGTLDPFATGLLIICIGKYTKIASYIESYSKHYFAKAMLGIQTDTYDLDGQIVSQSDVNVNENELKDTIKGFSGLISQTPPKFSALKINGVRACDLARKGESFEIKKRNVHLYDINLIDYKKPYFTFFVHCEKGTYVRSIANDIGEKLKCGCHLVELKRTKIGDFDLNNAISINAPEDILIKSILSADKVLYALPDLLIKQEFESYIFHGKKIKNDFFKNEMTDHPLLCKIVNEKKHVLAIVEYLGHDNFLYKKVLAS